jgi:hypothetical protein
MLERGLPAVFEQISVSRIGLISESFDRLVG